MMIKDTLYSSASAEWETPQDMFNQLDREFHFTLDACATPENAKVQKFFTAEDDGLMQSWGGETVWCNPPYGRQIAKWARKAWEEGLKPGTTVVMLLPARTDTKWFHHWVYNRAEIRFLYGRLRFGGSTNNAPFP